MQQRALENIKTARDERDDAQARFTDADHAFRLRVIAASKLGCSLDQIATAASVSKTRVHQIIQDK